MFRLVVWGEGIFPTKTGKAEIAVVFDIQAMGFQVSAEASFGCIYLVAHRACMVVTLRKFWFLQVICGSDISLFFLFFLIVGLVILLLLSWVFLLPIFEINDLKFGFGFSRSCGAEG